MVEWINPEHAELVAAYRELEEQPEAAGLPGIRGFVIPAADKQE